MQVVSHLLPGISSTMQLSCNKDSGLEDMYCLTDSEGDSDNHGLQIISSTEVKAWS